MQVAKVLVFRGVSRFFSYAIPRDLSIEVGDHLKVPFGNASVGGLVIGFEPAPDAVLKPIEGLDAKKSSLDPSLVDLILWFYQTYLTTPYKAYQTIIGMKRKRILKEDKPSLPPFQSPFPLTEDQQEIIRLLSSDTAPDKALLHGVTGSGKTEVYIQLAHLTLLKQKQVIILVPEIALTPQLRDRFQERFGPLVSVLHSGLTQKEKEVEWARMDQGFSQIVIGPRSAIFSPFRNLGLIVIDEEHETTYKQDSHPRYKTHAVAFFRQQYHHAQLVLGSATPDICSMAQTRSGDDSVPEVMYLSIGNRIHNRPLPLVTLVDLKEEYEAGRHGSISHPLQVAISEALSRREKVMILINRRGYASLVVCRSCKKVHACPQCQLSYTYHHDRAYRCHRCNRITPATPVCPSCQKPALTFMGSGTQKVEAELLQLYPQAKISRLDKDTGTTYQKIEAVLDAFKTSGDILVGTQLIAKGHDIAEVTVIGILGIDQLLNIPDYRSSERAFQLLTQAAGRPGRGEKPGRVFIQTHFPYHPAVQSAFTHDSLGYFEKELLYREALYYPPFSKLTVFIFSSLSLASAESACKQFSERLQQALEEDEAIQFMGPKKAPFEKVRNFYRWHLVIKAQIEHQQILHHVIQTYRPPKDVRFMVDFDPVSIL